MALTPKQERFAQNVALKRMNQSQAYAEAYDATGKTQEAVAKLASSVASHSEVKARIVVLTGRAEAEALKKGALTLEQSLEEAGQMFEDAKALGNTSAGVAAAKLRAQLSGHLVEKADKNRANDLEGMDVEGLAELRIAVEAKLQSSRDALAAIGMPVTPPAVARRVIG